MCRLARTAADRARPRAPGSATTELDGYHGDTSATFVIGDAPPHARALVELARGARDAGIAAAVPGARLGDIGAAIGARGPEITTVVD
jgi:methionine aminopeptidase